MRRWDLAIDTYNRIVEKVAAKKDGYERMRLERVLYELGDSQFQSSRFNDANATFAKVVAGANASPNERASAHMWMGKMADTSGRRPDAVRHYRAIRELDCSQDLKSEAKRYEKKPFGG
jgi:lipopolysaccharide biosynthesis regulator YciM